MIKSHPIFRSRISFSVRSKRQGPLCYCNHDWLGARSFSDLGETNLQGQWWLHGQWRKVCGETVLGIRGCRLVPQMVPKDLNIGKTRVWL